MRVIVVDNASEDGVLKTVDDAPIHVLKQPDNRGFAYGCNVGWRAGSARYVLLLNPDAVIDPPSVERLVDVLEREGNVGICAPLIRAADGSLEFSQRRFPTVRATFAQALFAHRLFPRAEWSDQLIRDARAYEVGGAPPWVSGACMLVRRTALETLCGLDEGFFLYGEDADLCRRMRDAGWDVRFEPTASVVHIGGASAPRDDLLPVLAASRLRFARKHCDRRTAALVRAGIALSALTHAAFTTKGRSARRGHLAALAYTVSPQGSTGRKGSVPLTDSMP
jgi:N-acetylglucosaminyl-diphospho-decaprenol L-rhamnosyltransferase